MYILVYMDAQICISISEFYVDMDLYMFVNPKNCTYDVISLSVEVTEFLLELFLFDRCWFFYVCFVVF